MAKTDKVNQVEYSSGGSRNRNNQKRKKLNATRRRRKVKLELEGEEGEVSNFFLEWEKVIRET